MTTIAVTEDNASRLRVADALMAFAVVLPLAAIIAPYRSIHLPQLFILGVALLGGLYCFRAAVQDVEQLVFIFMLYIPFQKVLPGDFGGIARAVNFTNAFLLLLVFGLMVRPRSQGDGVIRGAWGLFDSVVTLFLLIITLSMVAEALRETDQMRYGTLSDLKRWLTPIAVYFIIMRMGLSPRAVKRMALAVIVTAAVIGLLGVKQFWMDMGGGSRSSLDEIRIEVTSGPSNLGAFFAYYVPYIAAMWIGNFTSPVYWGFIFPFVWCMDALRVTFSRGAAVAFLAAVAAMVWRKSHIVFLLAAPMLAALLYFNPVSLPYSVFGRMTGTYRADRSGDALADKLDKSARTRLVIWEGGWQMIREHPLFGVGYGQFPKVIGEYAPEVAGMDPHNNALKIAAEMGIPALVVFIMVMGLCFLRGYRLYGKIADPFLKAVVLGYVGSVVGLFVANLFGSRLDSEEITTQFWAMTACVMLLWRHERSRGEESAAGDVASDET